MANEGNSTIEKFDGAGNPTVFANTGLNTPIGLVFDADGNLSLKPGNNTIEQFDLTETPTTFANAGLNIPLGLAFDTGGKL